MPGVFFQPVGQRLESQSACGIWLPVPGTDAVLWAGRHDSECWSFSPALECSLTTVCYRSFMRPTVGSGYIQCVLNIIWCLNVVFSGPEFCTAFTPHLSGEEGIISVLQNSILQVGESRHSSSQLWVPGSAICVVCTSSAHVPWNVMGCLGFSLPHAPCLLALPESAEHLTGLSPAAPPLGRCRPGAGRRS